MKKLLFIIPCMIFLVTSCDFFEMDNYDPYNTTITGIFIDAATGENVQQECKYDNRFGGNISTYTTGFITAFEQGWDYEAAQYWLVKYDGTYLNTQIFSGTYRLEANENNFYPVKKEDVVLKKGSNTIDWEVVPYVRIIDPVIVFDEAVQKFKATFKLEYGDATKANTMVKIMLCSYQDAFVGLFCNNSSGNPEANKTTGIVVDGVTENTLYIDPAATTNRDQFKYSPRMHYFRIAACAVGPGNSYNGSLHYNYSPTVSIQY